MSIERLTEVTELQKERVSGAQKTINNDISIINDGRLFEAIASFQLAATNGTRYLTFTTPAGKYIHYYLTGITCNADKLLVKFYESATVTAATGTAVSSYNHNRNSTITPASVVLDDPTVTADGTLFTYVWLPGSTGVGQTRTGGAVVGSGSKWILKPSTQYAIKFENTSASANDVQVNVLWTEETVL